MVFCSIHNGGVVGNAGITMTDCRLMIRECRFAVIRMAALHTQARAANLRSAITNLQSAIEGHEIMKAVRILPIITVVSLVVLESSLTAQIPPDASVRVDEIFEPWNSVDMPGCAVGVAVNGLTVLSRAYGMADLEHDVFNTPETIFEAGSVSKQFTAAAIILLALDGKLSLDDDVRQYVPEVYDYGTTITLRHMMTHTSGLRDWGSVAEISGWGRQNRTHTHAHVLDIMRRQTALNFPPGSEYSYSNSGYNLLAIVAGRVSGMSFAEFSQSRIFEPLGMTSTQWRDDYTRIVEGRSTAYRVDGHTVRIMRPIEDVHGNGGLLTTVRDLLIWNEALELGKLGAEFNQMMHEQGRLNDGSQTIYAGGLRIRQLAGVPAITHTGSTSGYRAFLGRYPDQRLSVAMLCNASNVTTRGTGERVARVFLSEAARDPVVRAVALSSDVLSRLEGLYRDAATHEPVRLSLEDGELRLDGRIPLIPLSENEFQVSYGDSLLSVQHQGNGRPTILMRSWKGSRTFEPVVEYRPSETELLDYVGVYYSDDAETAFTVAIRDSSLIAAQRPGVAFLLNPLYRDAFDGGWTGFMRFERDASGEVFALHLSIPRVYDMQFDKVGW